MVNGLQLFCATFTSCKRGQTLFVQAGAKKSNTSLEVVKLETHAVLGRAIPEGWVLVLMMKVWSSISFSKHSTFYQWSFQSAALCCWQINWWVVVWQVQTSVSIWDVVHSHLVDRWVLSEADCQVPWHSMLELAWLLCDEAHQVGCGLSASIERMHSITAHKVSLIYYKSFAKYVLCSFNFLHTIRKTACYLTSLHLAYLCFD